MEPTSFLPSTGQAAKILGVGKTKLLAVEVRTSAGEASPRMYESAAYSVDAFCRAHSLSRSKFYEMLRSGEGPRVMKCGAKTLVSAEAARDWRLARERAAAGGPSRIVAGKAVRHG